MKLVQTCLYLYDLSLWKNELNMIYLCVEMGVYACLFVFVGGCMCVVCVCVYVCVCACVCVWGGGGGGEGGACMCVH